MRRSLTLLLVLGLFVASCDSQAPPEGPLDLSRSWTEAAPEAIGLDPAAMEAAVAQADAILRFRSLLVVRNGRLGVEAYFRDAARGRVHDVRSVTKSVVGTLTGIAIDQGHLSLDTPIGDVLWDEIALLSPEEEAITVRDLLTMSGGWEWPEIGGPAYGNWITSQDHIQHVFDQPLADPPGSRFQYNTGAVHVLGVVLEEAVGESLPDYADRVLFGPLGIDERVWEASTGGRVNGGAGLDLRPRDLARLGQLMLQRGASGEGQIVPSAWVDASTAPAYDWRSTYGPLADYTYGHLWWVVDGAPPDAFLAWGYGGQFIYVVPNLDLVVVATTEWRGVGDAGADALEIQALDVILNTVLPGVR